MANEYVHDLLIGTSSINGLFFFVIAERLTSATGADLVQLLFIAGKYQNNLKMHL